MQQYIQCSSGLGLDFSLLSCFIFCPSQLLGSAQLMCWASLCHCCALQRAAKVQTYCSFCFLLLASQWQNRGFSCADMLYASSVPTEACWWNWQVFLLGLSLVLKMCMKEQQCTSFSHAGNLHSWVFGVNHSLAVLCHLSHIRWYKKNAISPSWESVIPSSNAGNRCPVSLKLYLVYWFTHI